jgi:hypothetical protein
MDNTTTTGWIVGAVIVVLLILGAIVWYNSSVSGITPGTPNTGVDTGTMDAGSGMSSTTYASAALDAPA